MEGWLIHLTQKGCRAVDTGAAQILVPGVVFLPGLGLDRSAGRVEPGSFIAGEENWVALAAVQRMIEPHPPSCFTLFGPTGTGKTHLLGLLCGLWKEIWPHCSVVSSTAAEFGQAFAEALVSRKARQFRRHWEEADFIVIDDLQFLGDYPAAQEEFVALLRAAERGTLCVAVACRIPPWHCENLNPRIGSILQGGLTARLQPPGEDARRAILQMAFRQKGVTVTAAPLQLFAEELAGSPRQLLGFALKLRQAAGRGPVDYPAARAFLRRYSPRPATSIDRVAKATARYFGIRLKDLRGPGRSRAEVLARNVAMYLAQRLTGASLQQIGHYFGGRDHTTVGHGCRKIEALSRSDPSMQQAIFMIEERLIPGEPQTICSAADETHPSRRS